MKLLFVINPKSGRGRAESLADRFDAALRRRDFQIDRFRVGSGPTPGFDHHDVVVIFGGDGTVHSLLAPLRTGSAALYHVPMGTENLFARQFGMTRHPEDLERALAAPRFARVDLGDANGRLFAIMCSAGPDASVVRRLAATRTGAIRHTSYLAPIFSEVCRPCLGPMTIHADGDEMVADRRGLVIIGNSPMYALGLNPARDADMTDGLLDVVFLPASSAAGLVRWGVSIAVRSPLRRGRAVHRRARAVRLTSGEPIPYQLDGDEGGLAGGSHPELSVSLHPGAVRVLLAR